MEIYADGGCRGNGAANSLGGWAVCAKQGDSWIDRNGAETGATNNTMELTAAFEALCLAEQLGLMAVTIVCDSQYVINGITQWIKGWEKRGWQSANGSAVANQAHWRKLADKEKALVQRGVQVTWKWVRGHADNPGNERADKLATQAMNAQQDRKVKPLPTETLVDLPAAFLKRAKAFPAGSVVRVTDEAQKIWLAVVLGPMVDCDKYLVQCVTGANSYSSPYAVDGARLVAAD